MTAARSRTDAISKTRTKSRISADAVTDVYTNTVPVIAHLLIRDFVLVFEIASVLLLAAVIGALALIRER